MKHVTEIKTNESTTYKVHPFPPMTLLELKDWGNKIYQNILKSKLTGELYGIDTKVELYNEIKSI